MDIRFATAQLASTANKFAKARRRWGSRRAELVSQRLADLDAAECLADVRRIAGCHELKWDRSGQLAMNLDGRWRLIFAPDHDPLPVQPDGGLDWSSVTAVVILEVSDHYE